MLNHVRQMLTIAVMLAAVSAGTFALGVQKRDEQKQPPKDPAVFKSEPKKGEPKRDDDKDKEKKDKEKKPRDSPFGIRRFF